MKRRDFCPDSGRRVVLGIGSIWALCRALQGNPVRLGSSPSRCSKNKQPKFSVTLQTGARQDSLVKACHDYVEWHTHTRQPAELRRPLTRNSGPHSALDRWLCGFGSRFPVWVWLEIQHLGLRESALGSLDSVLEVGDTVLALMQRLTCQGSTPNITTTGFWTPRVQVEDKA